MSWAASALMREARRAGGQLGQRATVSQDQQSQGIGTWGQVPGASQKGQRRVRGQGLQQAMWLHGPAGPVDISAPTLLMSVCLSDGALTCLTPPLAPPELGMGRTVWSVAPCAYLPRKDPGLAPLRAENAHRTSQVICSHSPGGVAGSAGDPCPQTGPLTLQKQGETSSFRNGLRTLKRRHVQIF